MKKLLIALCVTCALAVAAQADDTKDTKSKANAEQKALRKEMLDKYDTNKDGKLDKEERAKMSADDKAKLEKAKMEKAGTAQKKKKTDKAAE